jgi:hypothetical protein
MKGLSMEIKLLDNAQLRAATAVDTDTADFGVNGYVTGLIEIENMLDQAVSCQLQGKPSNGSMWQNIGSAANVPAWGAGSISVTLPWGVLRVRCTPGGVPTSGALNIWLARVIH